MKVEISDLELQERTIGLPPSLAHTANIIEIAPSKEFEINSDISDLELEERTISSQRKFVLDTHMEEAARLDGRLFAAGAKKIKQKNTNINSGCSMVFLVLGASALLSIWGITRII